MGRARVKTVTLPAPSGGLNTIGAIGALPPGDLVYSWNLVASELGLRARNGYQEWVTGLGGEVRTLIAFQGGRASGSTDKLFACTTAGIWDCTSSTTTPTKVVTFFVTTANAGYGASTVITTPGGRYLVYCDEENGAYVYSEADTSWTQLRYGATVAWAATTDYLAGDLVVNGANAYICVTPGTSAGAGGPTGQGAAIVDGTVTWDFYEGTWTAATTYASGCYVINDSPTRRIYKCMIGGVSAGAGGPTGIGTGIVDGGVTWDYVVDYSPPVGMTLEDQHAGYNGKPEFFVQAVVWKSRLWFVEKDSSRGWYMGVNSLYGTASSFDFGVRMRAGGDLRGLYNWSYDAGNGLETLLVALSGSGDVVIYAGTDPTSVNTFGLKGTWSVGAVPVGRRLVTDYGGDVLVMSLLGLVPLSKLVVGQPVVGGDRSIYLTEKVANFFALAAAQNKSLQGWQVVMNPAESALMLLLPTSQGAPCNPLVMPFASRTWWPYRDLPIYTAAPWQGQLYFGTTDGRVCVHAGYVDGVELANPDAYSAVQFSCLTGFNNLGSARQKRVQLIRPTLLAQSRSTAIQATARFRFDISEPAAPSGLSSNPDADAWDTAVWDSSRWGGDYQPLDAFTGGAGVGRDVAIAIRGAAVSRTVIASIDVFYDEGGLL